MSIDKTKCCKTHTEEKEKSGEVLSVRTTGRRFHINF